MPNEVVSNVADPVARIGSAPDPDRPTRTGHWVGISTLAGAIALAAVAVPPLLAPDERRPDGSQDGVVAPAATTAPTDPASPSPVATEAAGPAAPNAEPTSSPTVRNATPTSGPAPNPAGTVAPAPTPAPSVTTGRSTPPPFVPISVQAEDPGNLLSEGAGVVSCATCEGGARVRYLGRLTAYLTTPTAGLRTITVTYQVKGERTLKISVNGEAPTTHRLTGTDWDTPHTFQYTALVPAGRVSLTFYNDTGPPPDIDKITVG
ncbi:hypothetical protein ACQPYA_14310 [Micromonospora sp. CA-263727]|uniref:hypothetical protein n=1 Tax=Micromonospora sp. CA-263727 TaxID=3239967 RepID=UPI003D92FF9A